MNRFKLFIPLIICVLLGAFFYAFLSQGKDPNAMPSALIDKPVPSFKLPTLGNGKNSLGAELDESILKGQTSLLNVWATWCVACRVEHPFLNQLAEQGVRIIGVNYKDEPGLAEQWLVKGGDPYVVSLLDYSGQLGVDLGVFGAPETYLIDADGIIRYKHIGIMNQEVWDTQFVPLIGQL